MKVLEAITDTNIGGAGVLLANRLKYLDTESFEVAVALPKGSALKKRLTALGVRVFEIDGCRDRSFEFRAIGQYAAVLKAFRPDLVNCHGALSCRMAARLCRVPVRIYTRHCVYPLPSWQRSAPARWLIGAGQSYLSDWIIAVAQAAKQNLTDMGVPEGKIQVIINGAEGLARQEDTQRAQTRRALGIPASAFVVGICARLEACKGHMDFLRAAEKLLGESDQYYFLIVGDGSLSSELQAYCRDRGLDTHVRFVGFAEDVTPYFNVMDLHVNCSVGTETSSLALSEGMSLGLPSVVSDYGGNPYMVRDGENGLLYPMGESDALAERIRYIANDKKLYERLSHAAYRRFFTELNAQNMAKQTEAFYRACYRAKKRSKLQYQGGDAEIDP